MNLRDFTCKRHCNRIARPGAHNSSTILVLTRPSAHNTFTIFVLTRCSQHLHYLGPSAMARQFQSLPAPFSHHYPYYHKPHIITPSPLKNFITPKTSLPSPSLSSNCSHITKPSYHHTPATGLSYAPVGLPPPSLSQVPSAEAGSSLMMEDSPSHQNVTIYAADTISHGVPSAVKQEETFDGMAEVWAWSVNEMLVPCPRIEGGAVVKEEELLDDMFGSADPVSVLQHRAPTQGPRPIPEVPIKHIPSSTHCLVIISNPCIFG